MRTLLEHFRAYLFNHAGNQACNYYIQVEKIEEYIHLEREEVRMLVSAIQYDDLDMHICILPALLLKRRNPKIRA